MCHNDQVNRWEKLGLISRQGAKPQPYNPGLSPANSQVNGNFAWHHTKHENEVSGCCCTINEMQELVRTHLRTFDLFNGANTGSWVEVSDGHAQFHPHEKDLGFVKSFVSALIGNDIGVETTPGPSNAPYDLQATTEEWHPLIGRRRWGSEPLMTRLGDCPTISIWTEAYEVTNNLNGMAEGEAHALADTMWKAYLNAVADKISVVCGGSKNAARLVIDEKLPVGPMPWR